MNTKLNVDVIESIKGYLKGFASYFNLRADLVSQAEAEQEIRSGVSFKGSQLIVLILAILVASLGLNTNSIPVIIGAMLISPLMGPIIGMGLALGIQDYDLLHRGFKNICMAVLGSIIASALYFLISPQYESSSQLLARTSPSIYDVLIGFIGGAAGILSIMCKNKGQVMPGVAIATSLMPPLCTAGYGLATFQWSFFFGALYLFFTNAVFILFASYVAVKLNGYQKVVYQKTARYKRIHVFVYTIVFITVGFSAFLTYKMIRQSIFLAKATSFVENEMEFPNTQVLNHNEYIKNGKRYIDVTLIGSYLPKDSLQLAMMNKLNNAGLGGTILNIKQGFSIATDKVDNGQNFDQFYQLVQGEIASRDSEIDSLKNVIYASSSFSRESRQIAPEVKVLFPSVEDLALSKMTATSLDGEETDTLHMIFIRTSRVLSKNDRTKLIEYVKVRTNASNVHLLANPEGFPWPQPKTGEQ